MNALQREQLRISLLRTFKDFPGAGLNLAILRQMAVSEGRAGLLIQEVETEIQYLEDKKFVALVPKSISPENKSWRITADGRDFLATTMGE